MEHHCFHLIANMMQHFPKPTCDCKMLSMASKAAWVLFVASCCAMSGCKSSQIQRFGNRYSSYHSTNIVLTSTDDSKSPPLRKQESTSFKNEVQPASYTTQESDAVKVDSKKKASDPSPIESKEAVKPAPKTGIVEVVQPIQEPSLNNNKLSSEQSVTLNQVIFASLNGHPVISAEMEVIRQARSDYLTSTLFPNPGLFTDIQLLPLTRPFTVDRQGGPPQQDVVLTYPIDWYLFGKRSAAMVSAQNGVRVTQAEFENLIRLRVTEAASVYYTAIEAKLLFELADENVENLKRLESITKQAVLDGGRPAIDANRVRLDLIAAEQRRRTAEATAKTAAARLRAIMAIGDSDLDVTPAGDLGKSFDATILGIEEAFGLAQQTRPDINSIQLQVAKASSDIVVQQRAARATVAPSFGYTRQYQEKAIGFPDANSWSAALTMGLPVYDRNQGNISKANAEQRRRQYRLRAALLELRSEVTQAVAELSAAQLNAKSVANEQIELASKVRDSIVEAYKSGGRPLIEVLDAQRNFREIYGLYITSRAEYWRTLYRYYSVIGRQAQADE